MSRIICFSLMVMDNTYFHRVYHAFKVKAHCCHNVNTDFIYKLYVGGISMSLLPCSGYYCKQTVVCRALIGLLKQMEAVLAVFVNEPAHIIRFGTAQLYNDY